MLPAPFPFHQTCCILQGWEFPLGTRLAFGSSIEVGPGWPAWKTMKYSEQQVGFEWIWQKWIFDRQIDHETCFFLIKNWVMRIYATINHREMKQETMRCRSSQQYGSWHGSKSETLSGAPPRHLQDESILVLGYPVLDLCLYPYVEWYRAACPPLSSFPFGEKGQEPKPTPDLPPERALRQWVVVSKLAQPPRRLQVCVGQGAGMMKLAD